MAPLRGCGCGHGGTSAEQPRRQHQCVGAVQHAVCLLQRLVVREGGGQLAVRRRAVRQHHSRPARRLGRRRAARPVRCRHALRRRARLLEQCRCVRFVLLRPHAKRLQLRGEREQPARRRLAAVAAAGREALEREAEDVLLHEQRQPRALQQPAAPRGAAPQRRGLPRRQLVRVRGGDGCAEAVEAADLAAAVLRERQPLVQRGLQLLGATGRRRQREDAAAVAAFPRAREARHAFARGGALAAARRPLHQHGAAAQLHNGALLRRQAVGQPHKAAHEGPAPRWPEVEGVLPAPQHAADGRPLFAKSAKMLLQITPWSTSAPLARLRPSLGSAQWAAL